MLKNWDLFLQANQKPGHYKIPLPYHDNPIIEAANITRHNEGMGNLVTKEKAAEVHPWMKDTKERFIKHQEELRTAIEKIGIDRIRRAHAEYDNEFPIELLVRPFESAEGVFKQIASPEIDENAGKLTNRMTKAALKVLLGKPLRVADTAIQTKPAMSTKPTKQALMAEIDKALSGLVSSDHTVDVYHEITKASMEIRGIFSQLRQRLWNEHYDEFLQKWKDDPTFRRSDEVDKLEDWH